MQKIAALILCILTACEPGVAYIVTHTAAIGRGCPDHDRNFILTRKLSCCPNLAPISMDGRFILGALVDYSELSGQGRYRLDHSSDYLTATAGALGDGEEWARLQIICPSTGTSLYDSGNVSREDAFCRQSATWSGFLFLFEKHSRRRPSDSCCPGDSPRTSPN